ncbi:MAG: DegT/DnrJ/EryC1/StrS family aminotransferase [Bacteroidota bacterium]
MAKNTIPVTKPFFPPQEEYQQYLSGIWERQWLTNQGVLSEQLEKQLAEYLGVSQVFWVANGTLAIQLAIKALKIEGEIITTPFSYVATTASIVWENCTPVFADVDPDSFNIDPEEVQKKITPHTKAILATHVFGNPCAVEPLQALGQEYGIPIIYDAAHTFGVTYKGKSVFEFGDISTTSFHATKLFHTVEGGAVFTNIPELAKAIPYIRNFGHWGPDRFYGLGVNMKNSELHAAMGLCNLKYIDEILAKRKQQCQLYDEKLKDSLLTFQEISPEVSYNYIYYPVVFPSESQLLSTKEKLESEGILPRRYFHPLLSELPYVNPADTPIAKRIADRVLCLPLYHDLTESQIHRISDLILDSLAKQ